MRVQCATDQLLTWLGYKRVSVLNMSISMLFAICVLWYGRRSSGEMDMLLCCHPEKRRLELVLLLSAAGRFGERLMVSFGERLMVSFGEYLMGGFGVKLMGLFGG